MHDSKHPSLVSKQHSYHHHHDRCRCTAFCPHPALARSRSPHCPCQTPLQLHAAPACRCPLASHAPQCMCCSLCRHLPGHWCAQSHHTRPNWIFRAQRTALGLHCWRLSAGSELSPEQSSELSPELWSEQRALQTWLGHPQPENSRVSIISIIITWPVQLQKGHDQAMLQACVMVLCDNCLGCECVCRLCCKLMTQVPPRKEVACTEQC